MTTLIENGATVLFQGDSITDAGRNYEDGASMGTGYAMMAAAWFSALYPEGNVRFLNRGISGNRAKDLEDRWQRDCLDLKPAWVSVMIGINDTWRAFDANDPTTTGAYEGSCRNILAAVRGKLKAKLVLIEPFVLPFPEDRKAWRKDLDPKIAVVGKLAKEFNALLVRMDHIFAEAAKRREPAFWTLDGVHPTAAGHALIAQSWLRAIRAN
jgi:lysophospholipase L1-like esterase